MISFDESFNHKTQSCQMDLLIRFWNDSKYQVDVRYWDSAFLGHSTAKDLLHHFTDMINELDLLRMVQVSMDGPKVKSSFHRDLQAA